MQSLKKIILKNANYHIGNEDIDIVGYTDLQSNFGYDSLSLVNLIID